MEYILLLLGFFLIIKSSDVLVDSASSLAIKCRVPKMVIALTIVAFGTCAPELAISFQSIQQPRRAHPKFRQQALPKYPQA